MLRLEFLKSALAVIVCLAAVAALYVLPIPVSSDLDFFFFYAQSAALNHGLDLYDEIAQTVFVTQTLKLGSQGLQLNPPAYPPWYYLMTVFLGWFDLETSARLWFICNVAMLSIAALLLNPYPGFWGRLAVVSACLIFPPTVGLLAVGQLDMPLLLGCALFVAGAGCGKPWWAAVGLLFMSFKPHLGFIPLCVGIFWLAARGGWANRQALRYTAIVFAAAALISLLVEPTWPTAYLKSLGRLSSYKLNVLCDTCSSLTIAAGRLLNWEAAELWRFGMLGVIGALAAAMWFVWKSRQQPDMVASAMAWAVVLTLLFTPYIRNYDYVLLLLPLLSLLGKASGWETRLGLLLSYLWSAVVCVFAERAEHGALLWVSAAIMALVLLNEYRAKDSS